MAIFYQFVFLLSHLILVIRDTFDDPKTPSVPPRNLPYEIILHRHVLTVITSPPNYTDRRVPFDDWDYTFWSISYPRIYSPDHVASKRYPSERWNWFGFGGGPVNSGRRSGAWCGKCCITTFPVLWQYYEWWILWFHVVCGAVIASSAWIFYVSKIIPNSASPRCRANCDSFIILGIIVSYIPFVQTVPVLSRKVYLLLFRWHNNLILRSRVCGGCNCAVVKFGRGAWSIVVVDMNGRQYITFSI